LTRMLAARCGRVLAIDSTAIAVTQARDALAGYPNVEIRQARLPRELPAGRFDLILASEILYYFSHEDLHGVLAGLMERLEPDGDLVAVHHRTRDRSYGYDGFNVHQILTTHPKLETVVHHDDDEFVLDILRRQ
jgi:precorrin-6B methylase 2